MEYVHGGDVYTYEGMMDYSVNLNPFGPSEAVKAAVQESLKEIGQYPDSRCRLLRKSLAEKLGVQEDTLIFGNGAAELIFLIVQAERPNRAVLTAPSFAEYGQALGAVGCEWKEYFAKEKDGFSIKEDYLSFLTEDVDLIFLCSPDNPSGNVIDKALLLRILRRCEINGIRMVLDECFLDFLKKPEEQTLLEEVLKSENLFLLRAFTKMHAMPGLRLGYGITKDRKLLERMERKRQPWSISSVAQAAGIAAVREEDRVKKTRDFIQEERRRMEERLSKIGVCWFASQVNYLLLKSPYDLFTLLMERGFLIRDCSNYAGLGKGYYRIAVRKQQDNEKLLLALEEIYAEQGAQGEVQSPAEGRS